MLERSAIEALIPHQGTMCLLDTVEHWDQHEITCFSNSHHASENPLREQGRLNTVVLIEYAAQAAAIHASLSAAGIGGNRTALIGAVKALKLHCRYVEAMQQQLTITARSIMQSADGAIYEITVRAREETLIEARVVLLIPKMPN